MTNLSSFAPKVLVQLAITAAAAALLWVITGDKEYLVAILLSVIGGVGGWAAPPAPGVTHEEVEALSKRHLQEDKAAAKPRRK